jgi:hypothetical protein
LAICLSRANGPVKADPVNSIALTLPGNGRADGSTTGNLNAATTFSTGPLFIGSDPGSGIFAGYPSQIVEPVSFNRTDPTSLTFSSPEFGIYTTTAITIVANAPGVFAVTTQGKWMPGTFPRFRELAPKPPFVSWLNIIFGQDPPHTGPIIGGISFSTNAEPVPEPSSTFWGFTGLAALVRMYRLRSRRRHLTTA